MVQGRGKKSAAVAVVVAALASLLALSTAAAGPVGDPQQGELAGTSHSYTYQPDNDWGVTGYDPGSENFQYDSLVLALVQLGDRIYAGGKFTQVTNGTQTADQGYLAAFDANTGAWISEFRPQIDWSVFSLAVSPDGEQLFVGGEFTSAGAPGTAAFAVLDPATGEPDTSFGLDVTYEWASTAPRVHDLEVSNGWLYLGGEFTHLRNGSATAQTERLGRVSLSTGLPDTTWRPKVSGGTVWEVEVAPSSGRVYAGGLFQTVRGQQSPIFAVIDDTSAQLVPGLNRDFGLDNFAHPTYPFVAVIEQVGDKLWVGGQGHYLRMVDVDDLTVRRSYQTNRFGRNDGGGGDYQGAYVAGDVLFAICHCWGWMREPGTNPLYERPVDAVQAFDVATGDHLEWYAPDMRGDDGGWALHMAPDKCLWIGGDINRSGNVPSYGLVRHCPTGGPQTPGGVPPLTCVVDTLTDGRVALRWSDANANGYDIIENGSRRWTRRFSEIDTSPSATYQVQAWGGPQAGTTTTCEPPQVNPGGGGFTCTVTNNPNGSVTVSWSDLAANGYDLSQDGAAATWHTSTSFTDFTPGTDYAITAWGNGVSGTATSCTNPNPGGGGGFSCTVTNNANGSVTVSWQDIGANGYDVAEDGGAPRWVTATTTTDFSPAQAYRITAWGNGVSGTTTTC